MSHNLRHALLVYRADDPASDFASSREVSAPSDTAGADGIPLDLHGRHFVPDISDGPDVIKACPAHQEDPSMAHLMICLADPISNLRQGRLRSQHGHAEAGPHLSSVACRRSAHRQECRVVVAQSAAAISAIEYVIDMTTWCCDSVPPGLRRSALIPQRSARSGICARLRRTTVDIEVDGASDRMFPANSPPPAPTPFVAAPRVQGRTMEA